MANNMIVESNGALVEQMTKFEAVLNDWGLPSENIIASVEERQNIMEMLPGLIASIPDEKKEMQLIYQDLWQGLRLDCLMLHSIMYGMRLS